MTKLLVAMTDGRVPLDEATITSRTQPISASSSAWVNEELKVAWDKMEKKGGKGLYTGIVRLYEGVTSENLQRLMNGGRIGGALFVDAGKQLADIEVKEVLGGGISIRIIAHGENPFLNHPINALLN